MTALDAVLGPLGPRIAWTLLHFLWQGAIVAAGLAAVLRVLRDGRAPARYLACLTAFTMMAACPVVTLLLIGNPLATDKAIVPEGHSPILTQPMPVEEIVSATDEGAAEDGVNPCPDAIGAQQSGLQDSIVVRASRLPWFCPGNPCTTTASPPSDSWKSRLAARLDVLPSYVLAGWLTGVALLSLRLGLGFLGVCWLRLGGRPVPPELCARATVLAGRLGLRSCPSVLASERAPEALALGLLRPVVLIPASWLAETSPEMLEAAIAHELAHVRRWDLWVNVFQRVVETLLFYHPAVWWVSRRMRFERELCCDELAVAATGQPIAYVQALEALARRRHASPVPALGAALGGNRMALLNRVRHVLGLAPAPARLDWPVGLGLVLTLLLAAAVLAVPNEGQPEAGTRREAEVQSQSPPTSKVMIRGLGANSDVAFGQGVSHPEPANVATKVAKDESRGKCYCVEVKLVSDNGDILTAPKVSLFDGQSGNIADESQSPFVTSLKKAEKGAFQPRIDVLKEGTFVRFKLLQDGDDGMVNVDATVEVSQLGEVECKTGENGTRQAPRVMSTSTRVIESVHLGEKLSIPLPVPKEPEKPKPTALQAIGRAARNTLLGPARREEAMRSRVVRVEMIVREAEPKTSPAAMKSEDKNDAAGNKNSSLDAASRVTMRGNGLRTSPLIDNARRIPFLRPQEPSTTAPPGSGERLRGDRGAKNVAEVQIAGNRHWPREKILELIRTQAGQPLDPRILDDDMRRLGETKWFDGIGTTVLDAEKGPIVAFLLTERPQWEYVRLLGNRKASEEELLRAATTKVGDPVDRSAALEGARKIEEYYRAHGFEKASVGILEGYRPEDRGLVYVIDETPSERVLRTVFEGNTFASDGQLRTKIKTRASSPGQPGALMREGLDEDINRLTAYYRSRGFFQVKAGRQVSFDKDRNGLTVTYRIDEGPRYQVRNVRIQGNTKIATEELSREIRLRSSKYFNQADVDADVAMIENKYGAIGHVFASVRLDVKFIDGASGSFDLVYEINEGGCYRVGEIRIDTQPAIAPAQIDEILKQVSLRSGDLVDLRQLRASEERLRASGLFKIDPSSAITPRIQLDPIRPRNGQANLIVSGQWKEGASLESTRK